jgi:endonuclease G, mitochondrial
MIIRSLPIASLFALLVTIAGCDDRSATTSAPPLAPGLTLTAAPVAEGIAEPPSELRETFDTGTKNRYLSTDETLPSGVWRIEETLFGQSNEDRKNGRAALRMRSGGRIKMNFDVTGAVRVTIRAAAYGNDPATPWQLLMSENEGRSWKNVGTTQMAAPGPLQPANFGVTPRGAVRFAVQHAGADGRINFDDFQIDFLSPTSTVTPDTAAAVADTTAEAKAAPIDAGVASKIARNRVGANHLALGNPSSASAADPANYLLARAEYVVAFNRTTNTANWVSWHLNNRWKGDARRTPSFSADDELPAGWARVTTADYVGSGFDRGHLCPSDDRDFSATENAATFRLTNIIPQAPANNQGPWRELEEYTRSLAAEGNEVYIVAGPAGKGGAGTNGSAATIGRQVKLVVPKWTWKVIAVVPRAAAKATPPVPTRVIAVQMPNDQSTEHRHWYDYRVSVAQLEKLTGYDFLSTLPLSTQLALEAQLDTGPAR